MLGIEAIQKMNQLAKDLYDRKVANSMEEAAKMAEGIISKGNTMSEIKERMDNAPPPPTQSSAPADADMVLRRLNFQINEHAKVIEILHKKVEQLNQEIQTLKAMKPEIRIVERPAQMPAAQQTFQQEAQGQMQHASTGQSAAVDFSSGASVAKQLHPKVSNYRPEDVAVDKIFYSGPR